MFPTIKIEAALKKENTILIDTRTPKEFAADHLPNAINVPLLSNEERAIVGTLYKQVSRDKAIERGLELFSKRMPNFMAKINEHKDKEIIIYCWRGGMRSRTVVALLNSLDYNVKQLQGGYKEYRKYVRERLENYLLKPKMAVLWGLTCTGKTQLLKKFTNSLDLEGLAQHRGSLFGAVGLKPRTQKAFENLLLQGLDELQDQKYIVIEGESRKIGDVQLPSFLYKAMLKGLPFLIKRDVDKRAEYALEEYSTANEEELIKIVLSLRSTIGKKKKQEVIGLIKENKLHEAAVILLENYYDLLYAHTLKDKWYQFEINNDNVSKAAKKIKALI
jgi:tRNA 2-selenouridine synthase